MATVEEFMDSPLVTWVRTFNESIDLVDFQDFCDGVYLNDVMIQIDQREAELSGSVNRLVKDSNARLQNWTFLLDHIKTYFEESLQQLLVMHRPDIISIVKQPHEGSGLAALSDVLLQLLGCAVQCPRKEHYIAIITRLDLQVQEAIVEHIKQITNLPHHAISIDYQLDSEEQFKTFYNILNGVIQERDSYAQMVALLTQERDYYQAEVEEKRGPLSAPPSLQAHHLQKELALVRSRLQGLQEEVEERDRMAQDLKNVLKDTKASLNNVKAENLTLSKDAKAARNYRDELDAIREKAAKVGWYEREIGKYKEKLSHLEFYKGRVEELRADNDVLGEARLKMADQLKLSQKRVDSLIADLSHAQTSLDEVNCEKQALEKKTQELIEENSHLEFERSRLKEGFGSRSAVRKLLSYSSSDLLGGSQTHLGLPISEELNGTMGSQITKLEMENESLGVELDTTLHRLAEAKQELAKLKSEMGKELRTKTIELQKETNEQRKKLQLQLTDDFEKRVETIKRESRLLRRQEVAKQQHQVASLLQQADQQKRQILSLEQKYATEKENCSRAEKATASVAAEKEQLKLKMESIQQMAQQHVEQLEQEVESLRTTSEMLRPSEGATNACHSSSSSVSSTGENILDVAMRVSRETNKLQRASLQEHGPSAKSSAAHVSRSVSDCSSYYRTHDGKTPRDNWVNPMPSMASPKRHSSTLPQQACSVSSASDLHERSRDHSTRHGGRHRSSNGSQRSASVLDFPTVSEPESCESIQQRRSTSSETIEMDARFNRNDKHRSSATLGRSKTLLGFSFFRRGDKLRRSMPDKGSSQNATTDKWCVPPSSDVTPHKSRVHSSSNLSRSAMQVGRSVPKQQLAERVHRAGARSHLERSSRSLAALGHRHSSSDKDSGCTNSPDTSTSEYHDEGHSLTSIHVVRPGSGQQRLSVGSTPRTNEKWKMFVDMIVELQDKNQQLTAEISELRRRTNTAKFADDRMRMLEEKSVRLEQENTKLRKICETLQFTLSGLNPYDKREYQYLSNT